MDIAVLVSVMSLHFQGANVNPDSYNQFNPGVAIQVDRYTAGVFHNSLGKPSYFGTYSLTTGWCQPFVGAVSGYKLPVLPAAGLAFIPWKKEGPVFTLTPMNQDGVVLGFAWRHQF